MLELICFFCFVFFLGGGRTRVSDFYKESKSRKKKDFIFLCLGGGVR